MAYEILQTCMLVPDVSAEDCSGWVQAWGSIGALIGVAATLWWQDRAAKIQATRLKTEQTLKYLSIAYELIAGATGAMIELRKASHFDRNPEKDLIRATAQCRAIHGALVGLGTKDVDGARALDAVIRSTAALGGVIDLINNPGPLGGRFKSHRMMELNGEANYVGGLLIELRDIVKEELDDVRRLG